jgi:secreted Zn-dependent insulinase-like peptidase
MTINKINFNNKSKQGARSYALSLISNMKCYDDEHILNGNYFCNDFDENILQELQKYIMHLYSHKPIVFHSSIIYKGILSQKERYYDTPYDIEWINIAKKNDNALSKLISIPKPNIFIPKDFTFRYYFYAKI